ncbi:MAG: GNAT family N-acetyltransferase [Spirochaetales bacterium]
MSRSIHIRRVHFCDIPYLYEICLKTGFNGKNAQDMFYNPYMLGEYYAVNYVFFDPNSCFVAVDTEVNENGSLTYKPKGYVLGCTNTDAFNKWMDETWLIPLQERYPQGYKGKTDFETQTASLFHKKRNTEANRIEDFPAHMHIDILPDLQGKGCGRALTERFLRHASENNVSAVHLGVSADNRNAIAFYQKMGFSTLKKYDDALIMGKQL